MYRRSRRKLVQRSGRSLSCRLALLADEPAGQIMNARRRRSLQGAKVNVTLGPAPRALDFQPGEAAIDGLLDGGRGIDRPTVAPHLLIPALTGEVVRFAYQRFANPPLLLGLLGEDLRHGPRLHQLFCQRLAVAAGERSRVIFGCHAGIKANPLRIGKSSHRL